MANPNPNTDGIQPPPNPAGEGNQRAYKHGAYAQPRLGQLRADAAARLLKRWPHLEGHPSVQPRAHVVALQVAAMEALDRIDPLTASKTNPDFKDLTARSQHLSRQVAQLFKDLDNEARERGYKPGEETPDRTPELAWYTVAELEQMEALLRNPQTRDDGRADALAAKVLARVERTRAAVEAAMREHLSIADAKLSQLAHELLAARASGADERGGKVADIFLRMEARLEELAREPVPVDEAHQLPAPTTNPLRF